MAQIGSQIRWSVLFTDSAGSDADPDTVTFWLREEIDGTEREWTYDVAPIEGTHYPMGTNPIEKDSTGAYSVDYVATKPERHTGVWIGSGTVNQAPSPSVVFVRHSPITALDNP